MRRIAPPLPAASMPSNTTTSERSRIFVERVSRFRSRLQLVAAAARSPCASSLRCVVEATRAACARRSAGGRRRGRRGDVGGACPSRRSRSASEQQAARGERAVLGSLPSITSHGASPVLVSRSASSQTSTKLVVVLEVLPVVAASRATRSSCRAESSFRRFFCAFFDRWNQNLSDQRALVDEHALEVADALEAALELARASRGP